MPDIKWTVTEQLLWLLSLLIVSWLMKTLTLLEIHSLMETEREWKTIEVFKNASSLLAIWPGSLSYPPHFIDEK